MDDKSQFEDKTTGINGDAKIEKNNKDTETSINIDEKKHNIDENKTTNEPAEEIKAQDNEPREHIDTEHSFQNDVEKTNEAVEKEPQIEPIAANNNQQTDSAAGETTMKPPQPEQNANQNYYGESYQYPNHGFGYENSNNGAGENNFANRQQQFNNYYQQQSNYPPNYNYDNIQRQPEPKKKLKTGKIAIICLCCLLAVSLITGGLMIAKIGLGNKMFKENSATIVEGQRETVAVNKSNEDTSKKMTASEVYAANVEATVGITTAVVSTNYFGYQTQNAVAGSGFILTDTGYIITNYHVVENGKKIIVSTYDNTKYEAKLVGYDEDNDIAVIKIDAKGLKAVILGDSDNMSVGDDVIAIGNPLGELTFSLTRGAVSAMNRNVTIENKSMTLIQTDCAINSGNSGGPLFNMYGEVIGIVNAKCGSSSGSNSIDNIAFAIPTNSVKNIVTSIMEKGYVEKTYIGVTITNYNSKTNNSAQGDATKGVLISSVEAYSPAAEANLQKGDIVTAIDGKAVTSIEKFKSTISSGKDGDVITLTVIRQGQTTEIKVTLKTKKESALPETNEDNNNGQEIQGNDGLEDELRGFEDFFN